MTDLIICAGVGLFGLLLAAKGRRPWAKIQNGVAYMRAAGFMLGEMAEGARSRLYRWPECVARARRDF